MIYLAHPYAARELGKKIQAQLEALHYEVVNPFDREEQEIYAAAIAENRPFSPDECESIVLGDLNQVESCEEVVSLWTGDYSIGTAMEVFFAASIGIPVSSLYLLTNYGNGVIHPWVSYLTTVFTSESDLIRDFANRN